MNPARFFSILTCKASKPIGTPSGGHDALTASGAAHYCQGMPDHHYQAALLRWADVWDGAMILEDWLTKEAEAVKSRERWRIEKKHDEQEMLRKLAGLSLWEMGEPGRFTSQEAWKLKAGFMDVDKPSWYRTWRPRYQAVYGTLEDWSNEAWRYVQKRMMEEA